jgi:hypothetical protein
MVAFVIPDDILAAFALFEARFEAKDSICIGNIWAFGSELDVELEAFRIVCPRPVVHETLTKVSISWI